ncbi:hypothetical protein [Paraburkholderia sp. BR10882]|uniref:hypothetical protein n=1 Tax=unclassified Paraburkholderia TaxID=2615204 RepID=UPI0034CFBD1A
MLSPDLRFAPLPWAPFGRLEWEAGMQQFPFGGNFDLAHEWIRDLRRLRFGIPLPTCPRLFISHRQIDEPYARSIAKLAFQNRFNYWLDVIDLDPARNAQVQLLSQRLGRPLNPFEVSILTAAIIEMALLNCTHVLAVMTNNTAGSQWVPYEYGRVKEPPPLSCEASCWWDTATLGTTGFPEYMYLGQIHFIDAEIVSWLQRERSRYPGCAAADEEFEDPGDVVSLPVDRTIAIS